ncbi:Uma2 family endonuclease [Microcoleus sp. FACHB-831]|uniref:Uma2 family endonuclease n=1 Tax=Microcoleus sp. FACHB-831 TaxID=2692827 RepID=UPI00168813F5|nr:Uma2 family endonuclease [Microcoleus sp. FACHB-831]MBD1922313.1 Uma2 family endonuclease [Microcoleus sp. FACHB-831]
MSAIATTPAPQPTITWPLLPDDFVLPDDPVENEDQPLLAAALRQLLLIAFPELLQDALIVSNFALCAAIDDRITCKAPDWMFVRPVQPWQSPEPRRSYTPHTEGTIPQVVMEFLSSTYGEEYSVEFEQRIGKWYFYEQVIKVPVYVIFQPKTGHLEVYALVDGRYQRRSPDSAGRYWIPGLDLFLGQWQGTHEGKTGCWLRWWNADGQMLLFSEERTEQERQRAEQERQRAERLAELVRQLGGNPDEI